MFNFIRVENIYKLLSYFVQNSVSLPQSKDTNEIRNAMALSWLSLYYGLSDKWIIFHKQYFLDIY